MTVAIGPVYSIERDLTDHRKTKPWIVLKDGVALTYTMGSHFPETFKNRKEAQVKMQVDIAHDAYLARLFTQDIATVRTWTPAEQKEIEDYAAVLSANEECWTFHGKRTAQFIARHQHETDTKDISHDHWVNPKRFHAEKRRVMAARVEAFKRAGLTLEVMQ